MVKNRLGEVLRQYGKKQVWLVEQTGINKTTISQIVNQKHEPSVSVALMIARALCTSVEDIFGNVGNKKETGVINAYKLNSVILVDSSYSEDDIKSYLMNEKTIKFGTVNLDCI